MIFISSRYPTLSTLIQGTSQNLKSQSSQNICFRKCTRKRLGGSSNNDKYKANAEMMTKDIFEEIRTVSKIAFPVTFQTLSEWGTISLALYFAGRFGAAQLSAMSLAISWYFITGNSILLGVAMGMESLCGQAFGAKKYEQIGVTLQMALILSLTTLLLISVLWWQSQFIFVRIGYLPEITLITSRLLKYLLPFTFSTSLFTCLSKYLISQGVTRPIPVANALSIPITLLSCHLLMSHTELSLKSVPLGLFLGSAASCLFLWACIWHRDSNLKNKINRTWYGWSFSKKSNWSLYLSFVLPSIGIICSEWWAYDFLTVFAGLLSNAEAAVGAMGIANAVLSMAYSVSMGFSAAAGTRVATAIGAGDIQSAKLSANIALYLSVILESCILIFLVMFPRVVCRIWTDDPYVLDLAESIMPLVGLTEVASGVCCMLAGILRSCGQLSNTVFFSVISHWLIGVPVGLYLGHYTSLGITGYYTGLLIAAAIQGFWMLRVYAKINYTKVLDKTQLSAT